MKKAVKIVLLVIVLGAIGGYIWWQQNKKKIIRDAIQSSVQKKTDSLYALRYDSSSIDELNGNIAFYNVSLQSDSAQKEILAGTDSLPGRLFFIKVKEVRASGVDVPGIIQNTHVRAKLILLDRPIVQIINTGADDNRPYTAKDTLELYERILGKFKSINADIIQINNGQVVITDRKGQSLTTLENININLQHFLVDSAHNYENVISYFIKNVIVSVDNIQLPETKNKTRTNISKLHYDATLKTLTVKNIHQYKDGNTKPVIELNDISITKLNTEAFISNQQIKAGMVNCGGGLITIYKKEKGAQSSNKAIEFSTDLDAVQIEGMKLGKTKVVIIDEANPTAEPFVLNDVQFNMTRGVKVFAGNSLTDILNYADWKMTASGFSLFTKNKLYKIDAKGLEIDKTRSNISLGQVAIKPQLSEEEFSRQSKYQRDRYDITFNNVKLNTVNFNRLIGESAIEADNASLQLILKIARDRTLPEDSVSKVGNAPYQLLMKMKAPVYISKVRVNNSLVEYTERGEMSEQNGTVSFKNVEGVLSNVTNIPGRIKQDGTMKLIASAKFLGQADINSTWLMPLTTGNGNFTVSGTMGPMSGIALNPLIEPLSMASVKSGDLTKTAFVMHGDDYKASINILFAYNNLKIEMLKKGSAQLKKKALISFVANALIKNDNPSGNGPARKSETTMDRQLNRSFFNLLWKTIFKGVKKTVTK